MLAMALAAGIAGMAGIADVGPSFRVDRDGDVYAYTRQRQRGARGFSANKRRARNKAAKASRRKNRK